MIVLKDTQEKILQVLESVAGIVRRRHTLPILANVLIRKTGYTITDGFPESGGGGASAAVTVIGTDADAASADATGAGSVVAASDDDEGGEGDGDPDRKTLIKQPPTKPTPSGKHRNVTATAGALPSPQNPDIALWRLPTVLAHVPVSRSHWWAGVASGRYPAPVKLSTRCVAWRSADIRALIPDGHPKLLHLWPPKLLHPDWSNFVLFAGLVLPCLHGNFSLTFLNFYREAVWQALRVRPKAKRRGAVDNCRIGAQHRLSTGPPCGQDSCPPRAGAARSLLIDDL